MEFEQVLERARSALTEYDRPRCGKVIMEDENLRCTDFLGHGGDCVLSMSGDDDQPMVYHLRELIAAFDLERTQQGYFHEEGS